MPPEPAAVPTAKLQEPGTLILDPPAAQNLITPAVDTANTAGSEDENVPFTMETTVPAAPDTFQLLSKL